MSVIGQRTEICMLLWFRSYNKHSDTCFQYFIRFIYIPLYIRLENNTHTTQSMLSRRRYFQSDCQSHDPHGKMQRSLPADRHYRPKS